MITHYIFSVFKPVHKAVHDDGDLSRVHKFDEIMSRLDSATRQIRNKVTLSLPIQESFELLRFPTLKHMYMQYNYFKLV